MEIKSTFERFDLTKSSQGARLALVLNTQRSQMREEQGKCMNPEPHKPHNKIRRAVCTTERESVAECVREGPGGGNSVNWRSPEFI